MRKGFDSLYGLVRDHLAEDPLSGHIFVFANRSRTRLKLLVFDGSGLWVCAKRLDQGRFAWPEPTRGQSRISTRAEELTLRIRSTSPSLARVSVSG